uniref:Uncharacterized protein n=1 Tax=Parascaris univalens TaxID=6257 RepID=A0A915CBN7_PARUN
MRSMNFMDFMMDFTGKKRHIKDTTIRLIRIDAKRITINCISTLNFLSLSISIFPLGKWRISDIFKKEYS